MTDTLFSPGCQPCAVCGEVRPERFRIWFDGYVKLYQCRVCGFVAQYPGPGRYTLVTNYTDYHTHEAIDNGRQFMYPERRGELLDMVARIAASIQPRGRILDVGCGDGHFLALCRDRGYECCGVENDAQLAAHAAAHTQSRIVIGNYGREPFPEGFFDAVTMIHVLEHMVNPSAALETAHYHLHPGGLLLVEVPSILAPHFLAYRLTRIRGWVRPPLGVLECHVGYYAPQTLIRLTERCGFVTLGVITGRWACRYVGWKRLMGRILDPLLNAFRVGGILLMARRL